MKELLFQLSYATAYRTRLEVMTATAKVEFIEDIAVDYPPFP